MLQRAPWWGWGLGLGFFEGHSGSGARVGRGLETGAWIAVKGVAGRAPEFLRARLNPQRSHTRGAAQFMGWAKLVCEKLDAKGHWSDYMDPCSGLAVRACPEPPCRVLS